MKSDNKTIYNINVRRLSESDIRDALQRVPFDPPATDAIPDPKAFAVRYILDRQDAIEERAREFIRQAESRVAIIESTTYAPLPNSGKALFDSIIRRYCFK